MQTAAGIQKGLKTILTERGKFRDAVGLPLRKICNPCKHHTPIEDRIAGGYNNDKCCAVRVLSEEPDFAAQKEWLTEEVEKLGHSVILYPKYHCELNFIENFWGWLKAYHRSNCTYNFRDLSEGLPNTIENVIPISFIRRAARSCLRFMDAYRRGLTGPLLEYAMKKYSGHRRIPAGVTVAAIQEDHEEKMKKKCTKI